MRSQWPAIVVGVVLMGSAGVALAAGEDVPLPRPAPFAKSKPSTPVRPARLAASQSAPAAAPQPDSAAPGAPAQTGASEPVSPLGKLLQSIVPGHTSTTANFDAKQRAMIDRVNAYLTSVQTMEGDFVQVGPDGSRSDGQFYLLKPGRIRFEYNPPNPVELIADGQSMLVRDRKLSTQDLYPLSQTPLRFLLADRIDLLKDTNVVGVYSDDLFVTVVVEESQVFGGTHRLMLMFGAKDYQLRQWTITDPQGLDTTVAIYNLDSKKKLDPDIFKITYERMSR
jgi:outer membrane lipoprotein-sorting protein